MATHNLLGIHGEQAAVGYLREKGYDIIEQNWHSSHKELDIIASDGEYLVVVEVKTRSSHQWEEPWQSVTPQKIRRIVSSANHYVRLKGIDLPVRFDILSIVCEGGEWQIEHIEDAFCAPY